MDEVFDGFMEFQGTNPNPAFTFDHWIGRIARWMLAKLAHILYLPPPVARDALLFAFDIYSFHLGGIVSFLFLGFNISLLFFAFLRLILLLCPVIFSGLLIFWLCCLGLELLVGNIDPDLSILLFRDIFYELFEQSFTSV